MSNNKINNFDDITTFRGFGNFQRSKITTLRIMMSMKIFEWIFTQDIVTCYNVPNENQIYSESNWNIVNYREICPGN